MTIFPLLFVKFEKGGFILSIINFHDPTVINLNLDDNGKPVSLPMQNESKQVVDGKIPLEGLPDEQYRIQITGYVEIDIRDKIDSPNKFKCDYTHGVLYFDQSKNGMAINIDKYYSRGQFYIPGNRVWLRLNSLGEVTETLDDLTDTIGNLEDRIDVGNNLKNQLDNKISTGNIVKNELDDSIDVGQELNMTLNQSINTATTKKSDLDASISVSITKKSDLDNSINLSNTKKTQLDQSISIATTRKNELDESISIGQTLKSNLDNNIATGNQLKVDLSPLINTATTKKNELNNTIGDATNVQYTLEDMIQDIEASDPFTERFIASTNQQAFTLTKGQYKNIDMMLVYIQGVLLEPVIDFTLIGDGNFNKIKIGEPLPQGTEVIVKVLKTVPVWSGGTILP